MLYLSRGNTSRAQPLLLLMMIGFHYWGEGPASSGRHIVFRPLQRTIYDKGRRATLGMAHPRAGERPASQPTHQHAHSLSLTPEGICTWRSEGEGRAL